jgi:ribosome-associated translation inhibitor RaiA
MYATVRQIEPEVQKFEDPQILEARKHLKKAELFKRYKQEATVYAEQQLATASEEEKEEIVNKFIKHVDVCDRTVEKCDRRYNEAIEKIAKRK